MLCNRTDGGPSALAEKIADIYLADELGPVANVVAPAHAWRVAPAVSNMPEGLYRSAEADYLRLADITTAPRLEVLQRSYPLRKVTPLLYSAESEGRKRYILFVPPRRGSTARLVTDPGNYETIYTSVDTWTPSRDEVKGYAGRYRSAEGAVEYRIVVQSGALALDTGSAMTYLRAGDEKTREFVADTGAVVQFRDGFPPRGFRYSMRGLHGLPFERVP